MIKKDVQVRREQKKSFLLRELSSLISQLTVDEPTLLKVFPTKVELSPGKAQCSLYLASPEGLKGYEQALEVLKLYRLSIKGAIAQMRQWRKMPDIRFHFDAGYDKGMRVNAMLDQVASEFEDTPLESDTDL